jgi:hypothetical protein
LGVTVIGVVAALLAVPWGALFGSASQHGSDLVIEHIAVLNGPAVYSDEGVAGRQTKASTPAIDVALANRGDRQGRLNEARIRILDYADLPNCFTQGGGPTPLSTYGVQLPSAPLPEERRFAIALRNHVDGDSADHLQLAFAPPRDDSGVEYLYRLRIALTVDSDKTLEVGTFLLALPGALSRYGAALPEDPTGFEPTAYNRQGVLALGPTWCFRRNLAAVRRLIRATGERADRVAALSSVRPSTGWLTNRDDAPPREAAVRLLEGTAAHDPLSAVFAASQTGDADFMSRIKREAADRLTRQAEADLKDDYPEGAALRARNALSLVEAGAARRILIDAERMLAARPADG